DGGRQVDVFVVSSRRRDTRWPRDWSSDVCSSDLIETLRRRADRAGHLLGVLARFDVLDSLQQGERGREILWVEAPGYGKQIIEEIGRASCRERVEVTGVGGAVNRRRRRVPGRASC